MAGMNDILVMTLGLLAGVVGCLAMPCAPDRWATVKPARLPLEPLRDEEKPVAREWLSEPGFADGLTSAAA